MFSLTFSIPLDSYFFFLISPLFNHTLALPFAYKWFDGTHIREVISLKQSYIFSNIKSLFFYAPGPCPASLLCFLVIFYHQSGTMRMIALEERRADTAWFLHQLWVLNSLDFKLHEKNDFICFLLFSQQVDKYLTCSMHLINIYRMNE